MGTNVFIYGTQPPDGKSIFGIITLLNNTNL